MTAKEYLNQAYRLEQRIKLAKMEIEDLQELSCSVSSPGFEEHYNATRNTEAPFVKTLYKIMEMQDKVNKELDLLLLDGELRETQTANYFSDVYPIDCTVSPANALFCRKNGTLLQAGNLL